MQNKTGIGLITCKSLFNSYYLALLQVLKDLLKCITFLFQKLNSASKVLCGSFSLKHSLLSQEPIIDLLLSQCGSKSIHQEAVCQIIQRMQNNYFLGEINIRTSCLRIVGDPMSPVFLLFWSRKSWS